MAMNKRSLLLETCILPFPG